MIWKPEQKDFDKLSQLDRIEYRQVKREIDEGIEFLFGTSLLWAAIIYGAFILFCSLVVLIDNSKIKEVTLIMRCLKFIFILPFVMFFYDIYNKFKQSKLMKELNEKYFSTSIYPKKRK